MEKENKQEILSGFLNDLQFGARLNRLSYRKGLSFYESGQCHLMTSSTLEYSYELKDIYEDFQVRLRFDSNDIHSECSCNCYQLCSHVFAAALQTQQELNRSTLVLEQDVIKYSRSGMMKRVMEEREQRARLESYQLDFADNIFGEHQLTNKQGKSYHLSFYDFTQQQGYCSCPDYQTNKLETCKHLIYAFEQFFTKFDLKKLPAQSYPFIEIFRHPLNEYQIAWFYPHDPKPEIKEVLNKFFDDKQVFKADQWHRFHEFLEQIQEFKAVKIRPEVKTFVAQYFEKNSLKERFSKVDFPLNMMRQKLFKYQENGALFIAARKGSIIADEIGLGKSVQALAAGLIKFKYLGFTNIKIVCPLYLKEHWSSEISQWVPEDKQSLFQIISFEEVKNHQQCDFLIVDEAQKIDDYQSGILYQLHYWEYQHALLITDSQISTSLIKFYAMSALIDPYLLTPLWELSYKHCLFSSKDPSKVIDYYQLEHIYSHMKDVYLRRNKQEVMEQLPPTSFVKIPVAFNKSLSQQQSRLAKRVLTWAKKDHLNHYDLLQFKEHLQQLISLGQYGVLKDEEGSLNPKLEEFIHFVNHKMNLQKDEKVLVFVKSKATQNQIQRLLQENRKHALIFSAENASLSGEGQFYIGEEQLQKNLAHAHHIIYYHWPQPVHFLEERIRIQNESQVGIQLNRYYVLETMQSFDALINRWQKDKPHFLHQILQFVHQEKKILDLGLRLKEELIYELKNLILSNTSSKVISSETQMELFEDTQATFNHESNKKESNMEGSLEEFLDKIIELYGIFDALNDSEKEALKKAKLSVSNRKDEVVIKIKKS